jgi:transposase-like protein
MTNEQMNALTKAIITGFTILAKAHMNAINASHSRQGAFLNTINEDPNCCALPIEPPAPVKAEVVKEEQSVPVEHEGIFIAADGFRRYTREFKIELCEKIKTRRMTKAQALKAFQLSSGMVDRWLDAYATKGGNAFPRTHRQASASVEPTLPGHDPAPAVQALDQLDLPFSSKPQAYSREFKVELCQKIISGELRSCTEAANVFHIETTLVAKWVRQYRQLGKKAFRNSPAKVPVISDDLLQWVEKHGGHIRMHKGKVIYERGEE